MKVMENIFYMKLVSVVIVINVVLYKFEFN